MKNILIKNFGSINSLNKNSADLKFLIKNPGDLKTSSSRTLAVK